jgi:5'-nucleotidase
MGHRVSAGQHELRATQYEPNRFHVNGTPADCVRVALRILGLRPDWVFSGINRGGNLGVDIYTSGTVAAAREAAIWGIPAVALSQYVVRGLELNWRQSAAMAERAISAIQRERPKPGVYWNVNLPHTGRLESEIATCDLDPSPQDVHFAAHGDGFRYAGAYANRPTRPGHDVAECFAGRITISELRL